MSNRLHAVWFWPLSAMALVLSLVCEVYVSAQSQPTVFEFVSVRLASGDPAAVHFSRGGRFEARNQSIEQLIRLAYRFDGWDPIAGSISVAFGFPSNARFDITAIASREWPPSRSSSEIPPELPALLRPILEDRFRVVVKFEVKRTGVLAMRPAKDPSHLGPNLRVAASGCIGPFPSESERSELACPFAFTQDSLQAGSVSMKEIALLLQRIRELRSDGPIVDQTGIDGRFDIALQIPAITDDRRRQIVLQAIEKQLGLRLTPSTARLPILAVERAELPKTD